MKYEKAISISLLGVSFLMSLSIITMWWQYIDEKPTVSQPGDFLKVKYESERALSTPTGR